MRICLNCAFPTENETGICIKCTDMFKQKGYLKPELKEPVNEEESVSKVNTEVRQMSFFDLIGK